MKSFKETSKRGGFTIVETLIVLTTIGIVAALVIPGMVTNTQKQRLVAALQKSNAALASVVYHAQARNLRMEDWNYSADSETFATSYIMPFVNAAKSCGADGDDCFAKKYTYRDGSDAASAISEDYYKATLSDGSAIAIKSGGCTDSNPSICASFIVDTNGTDGPNQWGKDVFEFQILGGLHAIVPEGTFSSYNADTKRWEFSEPEKITQDCIAKGTSCAAKIISDGWEINY